MKHIVMLDKKPILRTTCDKIAALNGQAAVAYTNNPLNLKELVMKRVTGKIQAIKVDFRLGEGGETEVLMLILCAIRYFIS